MLIGEIDYSTMLIDNLEGNNTVTGASLVPYTETSFAVFFIFLWAMPIVLMNLLVSWMKICRQSSSRNFS